MPARVVHKLAEEEEEEEEEGGGGGGGGGGGDKLDKHTHFTATTFCVLVQSCAVFEIRQ